MDFSQALLLMKEWKNVFNANRNWKWMNVFISHPSVIWWSNHLDYLCMAIPNTDPESISWETRDPFKFVPRQPSQADLLRWNWMEVL